jgi:outer membrane receptor protein involved in Fe transport
MLRRIASTSLPALILVGASLAAQQPDTSKADTTRADTGAVTLPTIEVVGSIIPSSGPQIGSGVPAASTTLSRQQIEDWETKLLTDAIVQLPGISSYDDVGSGYKFSLAMRGFNASPVVGLPQGISVFLDGIRQNEPDAAQVNFDLLPMEHIRRVEVLYGNATLLGRNSIGGAINLISDRGEGPLKAELEASGGSFNTFSGQASVSGSRPGGWDYYAGGGYETEDGWRQATNADQYNGFVSVGRLRPTHGIRFQAYGAKANAMTAGSLPESVFEVKPDSNLSTGDYEHLNSIQLATMGYARVGTGTGSFNFFYRRHRADRFNVNQPADPDVLSRSRNDLVGGSVDYRWARNLGASRLGLRLGAEGSTSWTEVQLFTDSTKFGGGLTRTTLAQSPNWDLGTYLLADLTAGRLTFSAGGRYDYVRIPFHNKLNRARDTTSSYSQFNPRGGVSLDAGHGVSLYSSIGRSFRAPAVIELACADPNEPCPLPFSLGDDPPLKPVTATTYEVGGRMVAGNFIITAALYRTDVRNDIFLFPFSDTAQVTGSTIDGYFGNLDKTRREGLELGLQSFFGRHSAYLNYTYTRATFESSEDIFSIREEANSTQDNTVQPGDRLPLIPDHQIKGGLNLVLPSGFGGGVEGRFIGHQWLRGDEANQTRPLDSYFVADARLGWKRGAWEVTGVVTNLFQHKYATFGTFNLNQGAGDALERFLTPGQRRAFKLVVRRSLGGGSEGASD